MERYLAFGENTHVLRLTSKLCIIYMERYRSGHNGADSKSVCGQPHVGSNPTLSVKTKERATLVLFVFTESITMQIAAGVPLVTVAGRAGHARTSTTTDIYCLFLKSSDRTAAEKNEELFD